MATRRKFNPVDALPIWRPSHTNLVNDVFLSTLERYGVTHHTYFERLRVVVSVSVVICACLGGYHYGIGGFLLSGLLGVIAPVVVLWVGLLLVSITVFLSLYFAVWFFLFYLAKWFLTGQLG